MGRFRSGMAMRAVALASVLLAAGVATGCGAGGDDGGEAQGRSSSLSADFPLGQVRVEVLPEHVEVQAGEAGMQPHAHLRVVATGYDLYVFPGEINGITLIDGTSYLLDIEITERDEYLADASSVEYELIEVIESTEGASS